MSVVGGVDEAGRGPVLGPMVMAIVAASPSKIEFLKKIGVKDSKLLTKKERKKLFRLIKQKLPHAIIKVSPKEIDKSLNGEKTSLNTLEAYTSARLIQKVAEKSSIKKVILDLPSKNKEEYISQVRKKLKFPLNALNIIAEFKADINYPVVSAASILAKVTRDAEIKKIEKKLGFPIGSGYPSDPYTIESLKKNFNKIIEANVARTSWKTVKEILETKAQTRLNNF
jgi:ribonuclease HII